MVKMKMRKIIANNLSLFNFVKYQYVQIILNNMKKN